VVEDGNTAAELKDGVLTLRIPKSQKAMPRKVKIG
jgi:HSP20 family molecular chaperone IbpA